MIYWLQITSGRGPEECRWVVSQLVKYLINSASQQKVDAELIEATPGSLQGTLSSALIAFEGDHNITSFISDWEGSVQWIGRSMFRPKHKRKNWFVSVKALKPVVQAEWKTEDIRFERMRSSGPGGQHANKTETAIRVTHLPTGLCAISQEERSQYLNKKLALVRLKDLLRKKNDQARSNSDQKRWNRHNSVERGNATHVFSGKKFNLNKQHIAGGR